MTVMTIPKHHDQRGMRRGVAHRPAILTVLGIAFPGALFGNLVEHVEDTLDDQHVDARATCVGEHRKVIGEPLVLDWSHGFKATPMRQVNTRLLAAAP